MPANNAGSSGDASLIAGSVLPIQRAEELLATLPGVISARILASITGSVEEIHLLTTPEVTPKQTVRNVESALIANLGMHVSHKKISVAVSDTGDGARQARQGNGNGSSGISAAPAPKSGAGQTTELVMPIAAKVEQAAFRRRYYFEDVEVRRSRSKGIACRVTLRKGDQSYVGEAEGMENERLRIELAARATVAAIRQAEGDERTLALEGCKLVDAFEREFVFVGVSTRFGGGRESTLTTGSAEVRDSAETSSVLAVLDATNRWLDR